MRAPLTRPDWPPCSHAWIDTTDPQREPVAPIIGTGPHMMQRGKTYRCRNCGETFTVPAR
jgi:hypothetical protein